MDNSPVYDFRIKNRFDPRRATYEYKRVTDTDLSTYLGLAPDIVMQGTLQIENLGILEYGTLCDKLRSTIFRRLMTPETCAAVTALCDPK